MAFAVNLLGSMSRFMRTPSMLATEQSFYSTTTKKTQAFVYNHLSVSVCVFTGSISNYTIVFLPEHRLIITDNGWEGRYALMDVESSNFPEVFVAKQKSYKSYDGPEVTSIALEKEIEISTSLGSNLNQLADKMNELKSLEEKLQNDLNDTKAKINEECAKLWKIIK